MASGSGDINKKTLKLLSSDQHTSLSHLEMIKEATSLGSYSLFNKRKK